MRTETKPKLTVSTEEAAVMLGMSVQSIRRLVLQGSLHPVETPNARKYRVSLPSVLRYLGLQEAEVSSIVAQRLDQAIPPSGLPGVSEL